MLRLAVVVLILAFVYALAPEPAASHSGGALPQFAGDVSTQSGVQTCTACHGSFTLDSGAGGVTVGAPASVAPGETVRITVTVDNQTDPASAGSRVQGFEAVVKDPASGEAVGRVTLVDVNTRFAGSGAADTVYVTHASGGTVQTSWAFDWTAPSAEVSGGYRVYAAGNAANGNGTTSGDHVYTATADIALAGTATAARPEAARFLLSAPAPNPVAGGVTHVEVAMDAPGDLTLAVVDGLGRRLRTAASGPRGAGSHRIGVDASGLAPGLYFLVADGPGGRHVQPMAVSR